MKNQKGFSLPELLVVLLVISIIVAIAVPNLLAVRRSVNEGSAIASIRLFHGAEVMYSRTAGSGKFTSSLTELRDKGYITRALGSGIKSGYSFALAIDSTEKLSFAIGAVPAETSGLQKTGTRKFCIAAEGLIRADNNASLLGVNISDVNDCSDTNYSTYIQ